MVEEMYEQYQQPVYLLGHSMGGHYVLYFLNHQPQAWKDKYIRGFISLAAPWGGAVKALKVMASGNHNCYTIIQQDYLLALYTIKRTRTVKNMSCKAVFCYLAYLEI